MKSVFFKIAAFISLVINAYIADAQTAAHISGQVVSDGKPLKHATVKLKGTQFIDQTDSLGKFQIKKIPAGTYKITVAHIGFGTKEKILTLSNGQNLIINFDLINNKKILEEIVVSGTMKAVTKTDSPVPVEVYTAKFFQSNPAPSIFDALQNINGVRPQLNCNVCNTGDIHMNGLEGPYTMILIDGMPIVGGLSSVYGLSGIPQAMIERVEIVKGPASTLYGSEAIGGVINIITKKPNNAPLLSADVFGTSWGEINTDIATKLKVGARTQSLLGINYFNFNQRVDNNNDHFTDVTLQKRISLFNKWNFERKDHRVFSLAARYIYEDRWGGEMNWNKTFRGGNDVYGESIYTNRWETFGIYQLPVKEKITLQLSANGHEQNSAYGDKLYIASQYIGFGQLIWNKQLDKKNDLLVGTALRYTYYNDNTPVNKAPNTYLPGLFVQDEISINEYYKFLFGVRYDYHSVHGNIFTPRAGYKWSSKNKNNIVRLNVGNGYRVANVFTEDHASLTGSREIEFLSNLKPETSWNGNINFVKKIYTQSNHSISLDATVFYTYFTNQIIANYDANPTKIIYDNLDGHAVSKGISFNVDVAFNSGTKVLVGATLMDVYRVGKNDVGVVEKVRQAFTEQYSGTWNIGHTFKKVGLTIDYTGNLYGPMRLPLGSKLDPRKEYSPWWSIQNIQLTKKLSNKIEIYGGVKNLLDWTPNQGNPFLIARANDPFNKQVQLDSNDKPIVTPDNPYGLAFDPKYVYAPNQGRRFFLGVRLALN